MSRNRGKTIDDLIVEREAELAWQRGLLARGGDNAAALKQSRQRATALGTAIAKRNAEAAK